MVEIQSKWFTFWPTCFVLKINYITANSDQTCFYVHRANDTGSPVQSATMTLTVSLTDTNDNSPVIPPGSNELSKYIDENVGSGFVVTTVTAADADSGVNAQLEYGIVSQNAGPVTMFSINNITGVLTTAANPDRSLHTPLSLVEIIGGFFMIFFYN